MHNEHTEQNAPVTLVIRFTLSMLLLAETSITTFTLYEIGMFIIVTFYEPSFLHSRRTKCPGALCTSCVRRFE